jgi:hypothetical protein
VYLRHSVRRKDGKTHTYWRLVQPGANLGRAGVVDDDSQAVGARHLEVRQERLLCRVERNELAVAKPALGSGLEHHRIATQCRPRARHRELDHERPVAFRPLGQRETLLEPRGGVYVPLDHARPVDLDAALVRLHLGAGRCRRDRLAAPDPGERQPNELRAPARRAVVHTHAGRLEVGA